MYIIISIATNKVYTKRHCQKQRLKGNNKNIQIIHKKAGKEKQKNEKQRGQTPNNKMLDRNSSILIIVTVQSLSCVQIHRL